jgi:hypothetical protein
MHVYTTEGATLPQGGRTVRFAVGDPSGLSSNSWVVSTSKTGDIYIAGRDNFRESKVSLHRSGVWRLAQTERTALLRPDLVPAGTDRVVDKWEPPPEWQKKPVVAFRLITLHPAVYLSPAQREGWKRSVVFIEPNPDPGIMTVVSVCVIPDGLDFDYSASVGGTIAVLDLVEGTAVHVVAAYDTAFEGLQGLGEAVLDQAGEMPDELLRDGVVLAHGSADDGVRFLMPLPLGLWTDA